MAIWGTVTSTTKPNKKLDAYKKEAYKTPSVSDIRKQHGSETGFSGFSWEKPKSYQAPSPQKNNNSGYEAPKNFTTMSSGTVQSQNTMNKALAQSANNWNKQAHTMSSLQAPAYTNLAENQSQNDFLNNEIARKAKEGIQLMKPTAEKQALYDQWKNYYSQQNNPQPSQQQPVNTPITAPSVKANTQDGDAWFIDRTGTGQRVDYKDILSTAGTMQQAIANAQKGGYQSLLDEYNDDYQRYIKQLGEQGVNLGQYGDDLTKYSQYAGNANLGLGGDWRNVYKDGQYGGLENIMRQDMGIGSNVDFTFNNWDDYDSVMKQLDASATALSKVSRDNSLTADQVQQLQEHYLKSHARARELGYGGATAPGWLTGFSNPDDPRWQGFVNPFERGFGNYVLGDETFSQYNGLGTDQGIANAYSQNALDSLTKLQALQSKLGNWENGNYDFDDFMGSNVASHNLTRYINKLKEMGVIENDYNPHTDGASHAIQRILEFNPDATLNDYSQSRGVGNYTGTYKFDATDFLKGNPSDSSFSYDPPSSQSNQAAPNQHWGNHNPYQQGGNTQSNRDKALQNNQFDLQRQLMGSQVNSNQQNEYKQLYDQNLLANLLNDFRNRYMGNKQQKNSPFI